MGTKKVRRNASSWYSRRSGNPLPRLFRNAAIATQTAKRQEAGNTQSYQPRNTGGGGGGGGAVAAPVSTLAGLPQTPLLQELIKAGLIKEGMPEVQALAILQFAQLRAGAGVDIKALMDQIKADYARYTGDITNAGAEWMDQLYGTNFGLPEGFQMPGDERNAADFAGWDYRNGTWFNPEGEAIGRAPTEDAAITPIDPNAAMAMRDPLFSQYAGDLAGLQETSDLNEATDLAWFTKNQEAEQEYYDQMMAGISTGTIPIGAAPATGGGGGGGGGYGGGGGGGGGGNGLGFGDPRTTLEMKETSQDRSSADWKEYHPGFASSMANEWASTLNLSPDEEAAAAEWANHILNLSPRPDAALELGEQEFYDMTGKTDQYESALTNNLGWSPSQYDALTNLIGQYTDQGYQFGDNPDTVPREYFSMKPQFDENGNPIPNDLELDLDPEARAQREADIKLIEETIKLATGNNLDPTYAPLGPAGMDTSKIMETARQQAYWQAHPEALGEGSEGAGTAEGNGAGGGIQDILDAIANAQNGMGNAPAPGNGPPGEVYVPDFTSQGSAVNVAEDTNNIAEQAVGGISNAVNATAGSLSNVFSSSPNVQQYPVQLPPSNQPVSGANSGRQEWETQQQPSFEQQLQNIFPQGTGAITPDNYGGGPRNPPFEQLMQVLGQQPQTLPASQQELSPPGQPPYYSGNQPTPQQMQGIFGTPSGEVPPTDPWAQYGGANNLGGITATPDANAPSNIAWDVLGRIIGAPDEPDTSEPNQTVGGSAGESYNPRLNPLGRAFDTDTVMQILQNRGLNQGDPTPPPNPIETILSVISKIQGTPAAISPRIGEKPSFDISRAYNVDTRDIEDIQNENVDRSTEMRDWANDEENLAAIQAIADPMISQYIDRSLFTTNEAGAPVIKPQAEIPSQMRSQDEAFMKYGQGVSDEDFNARMARVLQQAPGSYYVAPNLSQEDYERNKIIMAAFPSFQQAVRDASENWGMAQVSNQYREQDTRQQSLGSQAKSYEIPAAELTGMGDPNNLPIEDVDVIYDMEEPDINLDIGGEYGQAFKTPNNLFAGLDMNSLMQAAQNKISAPREVTPQQPSSYKGRSSYTPVSTSDYNWKPSNYNQGKKVAKTPSYSSSKPSYSYSKSKRYKKG